MVIYGASGHGKVIEDVIESMGQSVSYFIDDNKNLNFVHDIKVKHEYEASDEPVIIAIGNNKIRKKISKTINAIFGTAIHPTAIVSKKATISEGTVVMAGAIIQTDVVVGKHSIINTGVSVDHECMIADFVHLSPHVTLCGNVTVGEGTWIGAGSTIIQGIHIGKWSVVGAGSVITEDIPDYTLVMGGRQYLIKEGYYKDK